MTLLTTVSEIAYIGQAGQTVFPYTFRVDQKDDMTVLLDGVVLDQGRWSITDLGEAGGGNVVLDTEDPPIITQSTVVGLVRLVDPTQEVDYQPFDAFPAETHERALDKLTMLV